MSSMVLSGDTSGAVTISAPAVAGTTTATLQAVTGTLALQSDGVGFSQTWQNVAGSRVLGTTYTNSTGKPIAVSVQVQSTTNGTNTIVVAGVTAAQTTTQANLGTSLFVIVPPGATYVVDNNQATKSVGLWAELR